MRKIENMQFDEERALYNESDLLVVNCRFEGPLDGESAIKECSDIKLKDCYMALRYPIWHTSNIELDNVEMTEGCRAAMWYSDDIKIKNSKLNGIKALRECNDIFISNTKVFSPEFGWRSNSIRIEDSSITGEYAFFECNGIYIDKMQFNGKYSFQYVKNLEIHNSNLKTKDAFWHAENVTVYDSVLEGEYLAWYSNNLTLVRCHIKGTQPLCYCKNLKLVDCTTEGTDLSFEYSDVDATIIGNIESIKNPKSGLIVVDSYNELIMKDSKHKIEGKVLIRK